MDLGLVGCGTRPIWISAHCTWVAVNSKVSHTAIGREASHSPCSNTTTRYQGLADRLAARFRHSGGVAHEDLIQAARVRLVTAVNRYTSDRGGSFIVYAVVCITGELRRCLPDTSWGVQVARTLKEWALRAVRAREELTMSLERSPTLREIGDRLEMTEEQVAEALEAIDSRYQWSPDEPIGTSGRTTLGALLPAPPPRSSWRMGWRCPSCWTACLSWSGGP